MARTVPITLLKGPAFAACSAIVHVALAMTATSYGHGSDERRRLRDETSIDIETIEVAPRPPDPAPTAPAPLEPSPVPRARPAAPPTHRHPYPVAESHDSRSHDPSLEHPPAPPPAIPSPPLIDTQTPRFAIAIGASASTAKASPVDSSGSSPPAGATAVHAAADVSVPAKLIARANLVYPPQARAAEVEAVVQLEIVIDAGGSVQHARVVRRAGFGLDEAALAAIRRYRFSPAERDGRRVPVRMAWSVEFKLE